MVSKKFKAMTQNTPANTGFAPLARDSDFQNSTVVLSIMAFQA